MSQESTTIQSQVLDAIQRNDSTTIHQLLNSEANTKLVVNSNGYEQLLTIAANKPTHTILYELLYSTITYINDKSYITKLLTQYIHNCASVAQQQLSNGRLHTHNKISPSISGEQLKSQLQALSLKDRVELVVHSVKQGNIVIVVDSANRENEGMYTTNLLSEHLGQIHSTCTVLTVLQLC